MGIKCLTSNSSYDILFIQNKDFCMNNICDRGFLGYDLQLGKEGLICQNKC